MALPVLSIVYGQALGLGHCRFSSALRVRVRFNLITPDLPEPLVPDPHSRPKLQVYLLIFIDVACI